jgi:hypothetical protein
MDSNHNANVYDLKFEDIYQKENQEAEEVHQCFRWLATREEFSTAFKWLRLQAGKPIGFNAGDCYHSYYSGTNDTFKFFVKLMEEHKNGK